MRRHLFACSGFGFFGLGEAAFGDEFCEHSASRLELIECAALDDAALVEHQNYISIGDR